MEKKKINVQMRIFTALAILFVVIAHTAGTTGNGFGMSFFDWFPATQFVISMFIVVAGYFYDNRAIHHTKDYLKKKVKRLLVPMYVWNLIYGIIVVTLLPEFEGAELSFNTLVVMPLWSGHQFHLNLATWFIAPLFFTEVVNLSVHKLFDTLHIKSEAIIIFLYFLIGMGGFRLAELGYIHNMTLLLTKTMIFLGYFALGMGYRYYLEKHDTLPSWLYFCLVLLIQVGLLYFVQAKLNIRLNTNMAWLRDIHSVIVPYIGAAVGMAFWLRVCRLIAPLCQNENNFLQIIGNRSYDIMVHHLAGTMLVKAVFASGYTYLHIFNGFDMYKFLHQTFYYYYPNDVSQFCFLYILAGIAFPLFVSKYTRKVLNRMRQLAYQIKMAD
jgi:fucose 4-O-acetylase-like acetyltransferase